MATMEPGKSNRPTTTTTTTTRVLSFLLCVVVIIVHVVAVSGWQPHQNIAFAAYSRLQQSRFYHHQQHTRWLTSSSSSSFQSRSNQIITSTTTTLATRKSLAVLTPLCSTTNAHHHDGTSNDRVVVVVFADDDVIQKKRRTTVAAAQSIINRRKSPALWRTDLAFRGYDIQTETTTAASAFNTVPLVDHHRNVPLLQQQQQQRPEIMAPAGGWPQLRAAVANGADSVYVGLTSFSARARADNFHPVHDLPKAVQYCHDHGVQLYVALNTLVFDSELIQVPIQQPSKRHKHGVADDDGHDYTSHHHQESSEIQQLILDMIRAKVDAVIVQDVGVVKLIQRIIQELQQQGDNKGGNGNDVSSSSSLSNSLLSIHASTQQTITSADGVAFCHDMGASRVVLGRELSVHEIGQVWTELGPDRLVDTQVTTNTIESTATSTEMVASSSFSSPTTTASASTSATTTTTTTSPVELEVFVHGALCVSYSGQCFSSEAWGGRSANRGQCAQACRLPYGLVVDGTLRDLIVPSSDNNIAYLLSPQDLCGLEQVPALIQAGVRCLKIEGRLKDELYVAATTRAYRQAVDQAWEQLQQQQQQTIHPQQSPKVAGSALGLQIQESLPSTENDLQQPQVTRNDLAQVFSRGQDELHDGLTPGFLEGTHHQRLVRGRSPRHRGVHVGRVLPGSSWKSGLFVKVSNQNVQGQQQSLQRGDGIVIDRGMPQEEELGGVIFDVQPVINHKSINSNNKRNSTTVLWIKFGRDVERKWKQMDAATSLQSNIRRNGSVKGVVVDASTTESAAAPVNAHVWKTSDPAVERKLRQWSEATPPKKLSVTIQVTGKVGEPLSISIRNLQHQVEGGKGCVGATDGVLVVGESTSSDTDFATQVIKAIGTLGNTRWTVRDVDTSELQRGVWCPISWIKEARRKAVDSLEKQYASTMTDFNMAFAADHVDHYSNRNVAHELLEEMKKSLPPCDSTVKGPLLSVLAREYDQVDALCRLIDDEGYNVHEIIIDFLEVDGMKEAVSRIRELQRPLRVVVASPRILKPGEEGIWRTLLRLRPDALLVRSTGLLYRLNQLGGTNAMVNVGSTNGMDEWVPIPPLLGDFSLNIANALTAFEFLTNHGLERVTASYDLSANAITSLARHLGGHVNGSAATRLEAVVHAKMPIFHTEHCVFARFLSKGNSYLDCGHVCTRHHVHLRDVNTGSDNLVLADMGCRNTVFAAQAQSGVHSLNEWRAAGIGHVRIELVDEPPEDVSLVVGGYLEVLEGRASASRVWDRLQQARDRNGRRTGVSHGSLRNHGERRAGEL